MVEPIKHNDSSGMDESREVGSSDQERPIPKFAARKKKKSKLRHVLDACALAAAAIILSSILHSLLFVSNGKSTSTSIVQEEIIEDENIEDGSGKDGWENPSEKKVSTFHVPMNAGLRAARGFVIMVVPPKTNSFFFSGEAEINIEGSQMVVRMQSDYPAETKIVVIPDYEVSGKPHLRYY